MMSLGKLSVELGINFCRKSVLLYNFICNNSTVLVNNVIEMQANQGQYKDMYMRICTHV